MVVLTGAGISRESGLDTFREAAPEASIWSRHRLQDVATPDAFARDPARVHAFYDARRRQLAAGGIEPNPAHHALVRLERAIEAEAGTGAPGSFLLVTQNVDDLHDRAGSRALAHLHGELLRARCTACGATEPVRSDLAPGPGCASCGARTLRPDVVWFGERPMHLDRVDAALERCTLFVSIGTSGSVHPAAGFVDRVRDRARTVELNLEPTAISGRFDVARHGPAGILVPGLVDELLGGGA